MGLVWCGWVESGLQAGVEGEGAGRVASSGAQDLDVLGCGIEVVRDVGGDEFCDVLGDGLWVFEGAAAEDAVGGLSLFFMV